MILLYAQYVLCVLVDYPQVHTVTRFVASEPDELDLEEADVVSVYQKSPDGKCVLFLGRLRRVHLIISIWGSNVHPSVRTYVCPYVRPQNVFPIPMKFGM